MILEARELTKTFSGVQALRGVSFGVEAAERVAMIGPNGAGKSTCFNLLDGQLSPDRGDILFDGRAIAGLPPRQIWRHGVGRTFQVAEAFASMSVRENVQTALLSFNRHLFSFFSPAKSFFIKEAEALLNRVGMREQAERACAALAYGDLKRLELALALANRPRLLLMDEPTAGMAPEERRALMQLATRLAEDDGVAVLFTEHDMDVVFGFATRIMVLHEGELIANGLPEEVRADARVREVYLGSA